MAVVVASPGLGQSTITTERRVLRGYAASRKRYDRKRRLNKKDADFRAYETIVRADLCSYCMGRCGQMAADHIDPLERGGSHTWDNLTGAGRPCNAAKKDKPLLIFLLDRGS